MSRLSWKSFLQFLPTVAHRKTWILEPQIENISLKSLKWLQIVTEMIHILNRKL